MSDTSVKLGLFLPTQVDAFATADVRANFEKIDAAPGTHICTSTTRPSWTSAKAGRKIYETNTGLEWVWTGTAWKRLYGTGLLKLSTGDWAYQERVTNASTSSHTYSVVKTLSNVVVPDGNRPIEIRTQWQATHNATNHFLLALYRSAVANSGPRMVEWFAGVESPDYPQGDGGTFSYLHRDGLAAGLYNFTLQMRIYDTPGGTAILGADTECPIALSAYEL
jgi:hypothetical protein